MTSFLPCATGVLSSMHTIHTANIGGRCVQPHSARSRSPGDSMVPSDSPPPCACFPDCASRRAGARAGVRGERADWMPRPPRSRRVPSTSHETTRAPPLPASRACSHRTPVTAPEAASAAARAAASTTPATCAARAAGLAPAVANPDAERRGDRQHADREHQDQPSAPARQHASAASAGSSGRGADAVAATQTGSPSSLIVTLPAGDRDRRRTLSSAARAPARLAARVRTARRPAARRGRRRRRPRTRP